MGVEGNDGRRRDIAGFAGELQRFDANSRRIGKQAIFGNASAKCKIAAAKLLILRDGVQPERVHRVQNAT